MDEGRSSRWVLIAANLAPLAGVLWFGWRLEQVFVLYWAECFIVGAWNVVRILAAQPDAWMRYGAARRWLTRVGFAALFALGFTIVCIAYGVVVATVVLRNPRVTYEGPGLLIDHYLSTPESLGVLAALAVSHGWSFAFNYLGGGEYKGIAPRELRNRPFRRIVVLHIVVIVCGVMLVNYRTQLAPTIVFVALKTAFDFYFHDLEHRRK
jgi:hypothetical protein